MAEMPDPTPSGTANMSGKQMSIPSAPKTRNRARLPVRATSRSLRLPTNGRKKTSQSLGTSTTSEAMPAATPRVLVR